MSSERPDARSTEPAAPEAIGEPLELLRPPDPERAHRVASFARLLVADARRSPVPAGAVELERVRGELDRQTRGARLDVLRDLLRHHLGAHLGGESFLDLGTPRLTLEEAWRSELERASPSSRNLAPPAPGESALSVARRILATAQAAELDPDALLLWRAWLERAEHGARAGEACFLAELTDADERAPLALRRALLTGLVECLLDRGAVREAQVRLADAGRAAHGDRRARVLASWCAVLLDEADAAGAALAGQRPWGGSLPTPLAELRRSVPATVAFLSGREARDPVGELDPGPVARRELGASVLAYFERGPAATAQPGRAEVAPGLRAGVKAWLDEREGALTVPGLPEQRLMLAPRAVRLFPEPGAAPRSVLGAARTRALLLEPVLDAQGELAGWMHVECEHRLLPTPRRARALAAALAAELAGQPACAPVAAHPRRRASAPLAPLDEPARGLVAEVFDALVGELGIRTQSRRCVGVDLARGEARTAGAFGEGLSSSGRSELSAPELDLGEVGEARALERAGEAGGVAVFDEPDARLSLHRAAASGVVLPLALRGQTIGALSIESSRRRDFRGADLERMADVAARFAPALRAAQFRAHHIERHGSDLFLDTSQPGFRIFVEQLVAAGRSSAPVVLCGEAGTGRTALARWLHFESALAEQPLAAYVPGGPAKDAAALLVEELEALTPADQDRVLERLASPAGPRTLATTRAPLAEAVRAGHVGASLAARLGRMELFVPALRERREELDGLLEFLLARFAAEERVRAPRLDDGARALLWRQAWPGNVRELEALAFKLVLMHAGEEVDEAAVRALARRFRVPLVARLPSRHPERRDLVAALRSTLLGSQRINKRRAALYLGWDPDTLAARLRESSLDEEALASEPAPWEVPWG